MSQLDDAARDVFSAWEIAQVAGVEPSEVRGRIRSGEIPSVDGRFVPARSALRAVRQLRSERTTAGDRPLFSPAARPVRHPFGPLVASGGLHIAALALALVVASLDLSSAARQETRPTDARMVFLAIPGPGGGGGGGGLRQPLPPPRAELKGTRTLRSPVPPPRRLTSQRAEARVTPPPSARPRPVEQPATPPPPPVPTEPMPQVVAPVATAPADARDVAGTMSSSASASPSNGPGAGGGAGTGEGTGMGEGEGSGIGPGSGGGTGGGPYRPGSGITAPGLLHEVRPDYTEDARRRGITGEVLLEIVVRRDGSVGDVRVLQGLGGGLDERAVAAVRQWRFAPARRLGTPVDVMVEVAVEFRFR